MPAAVRQLGLRPGARRLSRALATAPPSRCLSLAYNLHEPSDERKAREAQSRPAILFLHGLFGSKANNRGISKCVAPTPPVLAPLTCSRRALARDLSRCVYALDLRNHGDSPHDTTHDYRAMAGDVAQFIAEHGLAQPALIGHSMGAKTAMTLALSDPSLVSAVVSVDNAPVDAALTSSFPAYVRGMRAIDAAGVTRQRDADAILAPIEPSLAVRQFLLANLQRRAPGSPELRFRIPLDVLGKALDAMGDFPFRDPQQTRYDGPALFIRGTKSKYVADDALPAIGAFFPRFELRDVDAGHWLISENPEAFRRGTRPESFHHVGTGWPC